MTAATWTRDGAGWRAIVDANVTLFAVPDRTRRDQPARGTKWRAGATHWDEDTRTASRFGRDVYGELCPDAKAAKALAEAVYAEATA